MSILAYNGAAIIAMAGKDCVAIACDTRMGVQGQTISTDFQKVFRLNDKTFLGLAGLATDVQSVSQLLRFKLNMYKMQEEREIKPKTLSAMISNMMYEKRFGPWFVEPIVAGLTSENKPFLSSMDCLGCELFTKDYVVAGTMEEALHGMCESLYRPDLEPEDLFETISQCLLSACNRDALSGWGGVVHVLTRDGVTTKVLKTPMKRVLVLMLASLAMAIVAPVDSDLQQEQQAPAIATDIAENLAEIDGEVDRALYNPSSNSLEVQDSDGGQRQNYASKDSGATVLDHAVGTKGSVNLLVPDKDRYMLIPCANDKKWIVISLSEDIHAEAIAIANYEKFSSMTKEFLVLGSINYPTDTWVVLGHFNALLKNGEQLFNFHEKHHVRYIKLRLISHYGSEYYYVNDEWNRVYGRTFTQVISQLEKSINEEPMNIVVNEEPIVKEEPISPIIESFTQIWPWDLIENKSCPLTQPPVEKVIPSSPLPANANTSISTLSNLTINHDAGIVPGSNNAVEEGIHNHTKPHEHTKTETKNISNVDEKGTGLDNFYIRMSKKIQALEMNQSHLEKVISETIKPATLDSQHKLSLLSDQMTNLTQVVRDLKVIVDSEVKFLLSINEKYTKLLEDNQILKNEMLHVWNVITTMKAGIMVAIVLSALMILFFVARSIYRCLTGCHRRAAHREWFRRMALVDDNIIPSDVDPLTQEMDNRVDRTLRFGRSFDDGAIQRNTLYRRVVHGLRQNHLKTRLRHRKHVCSAPAPRAIPKPFAAVL
ncbi:proteasome subunit beta type-3 [Thraustotheca clavata]|uniref:Proteasome subunit beta type-3 n=1 Tax=Thraustotheca clavata TaxID=74557 RepID=A0A1V9ZF93_9STRA|nr:proteasome subunit beta type-3 [Thraustotheca clavata]